MVLAQMHVQSKNLLTDCVVVLHTKDKIQATLPRLVNQPSTDMAQMVFMD